MAVVSRDMSTLAPAVGSGSDNASSQLPRMLGAAGFLTAAMAVAAAVFRSPPSDTFLGRRHKIGFYAGLGGAFAAGVAEMWAAQWVNNNVPSRCAVGKKLLCAAAVPLVVAAGFGGFTFQLKY
ncbi:hypothetical protein ABZP36_026882 [Zizania latifolia]